MLTLVPRIERESAIESGMTTSEHSLWRAANIDDGNSLVRFCTVVDVGQSCLCCILNLTEVDIGGGNTVGDHGCGSVLSTPSTLQPCTRKESGECPRAASSQFSSVRS